MLAVVSSWAQTTPDRWSIDVSTAPVYVEVEGRDVGANGSPNVREFTITTPTGATGFTVQAVEVANGGTLGTFATSEVTKVSENNYKATFTAASITSVGITHFYIQIKNSEGTIVTTTAATPFEVNVFDKTKARILTNPGDQYITIGQNNIDITLAPVSAAATVTANPASDNKGSITVGSSLTTKDAENNLVTLSVDASSAQLDDKVTITITPPENSYDRNGNAVQSVTFTLTVAKPELPVKYTTTTREFRVGKVFPSPLGFEDDFKNQIGTNYTEEYEVLDVPGYENNVVSIDKTATPQTLTNNHAGFAQVRGTFTPKENTTFAEQYRAWSRVLNISVLPAKYGLTFDVTQSGNTWTPTNQVVSIDPTPNAVVADPNDNANNSKYTITYSIEGALKNTAEVNPSTGVVTILNSDVSQKFNLVATLTPNNTHDFVGVNATAQISVEGTVQGAYLEKQEDGTTWIAYLASPGETGDNIVAKFDVRSKVSGEESRAPWDLLADLRTTGEVINVSGNINVFNIAQLAHAMGVEETVKYTGTMKTLDMSGCQMVGPFTIEGNFPVTGVNVEYKNTEGTVVNTDGTRAYKKLTFKNVDKFVFPMPDADYTVLPAGFHKFFGNEYNPSDNNLTSLSFPEGWTEIEDGFSGLSKAAHYTTSAMAHLTELKLANTLEKIGAYAFSDLKVEVLTMPYNIHRIDDHAFNMSSKLQDVYFTGPAPEYVHTFAFAPVSQMCNNTVEHDTDILNGKLDPEITRYPYTNNNILGCLLHFPEEYRSSYTDETRVYRRFTKEEVDAHNAAYGTNWNYKYEKGGKRYFPAGWTDDFISNVNNRSPKDPNAAIPTSGSGFIGVNYGAKDQYYGEDMVWPSQDELEAGYAIAQAGYQWSGQSLRSSAVDGKPIQYQASATYENGEVDRRGLYQFIVAMGNADIHFKFAADQWYTIALPFNMTPAEIRQVFGDKTQVCRFSKVTRVTDGDEKQIKLEFRKSTMGDMTGEFNGTNYDDYANPYTNDLQVDEYTGEKPGIIHHFPYMIRPSGTTENDYVKHTSDGNGNSIWEFNGLDFPRIQGTLHPEQIKPANDASHPGYIFAPILSKNRIKPNSYILAERKDKPQYRLPNGDAAYRHEYVFYKGVKKYADAEKAVPVVDGDGNYVYEPGGSANQNTAYIQLPITASGSGTFTEIDWGKKDLDTFFGGSKAPSTTGAKLVNTLFIDDEDDATEIEKVVIVCGQDGIEDNIVYTINGVRVNGDYLPAGLYIKNGKKFIVK